MLLLDIETSPILAYIWHPAEGYVNPERIIHESYHICWAAKWEGERKIIHSDVLTPSEAVAREDGRIVASLAELVREADAVVAHNGDRFDVPKLNSRLLLAGAEPLGSVRKIDTLKLAKRNFRLASNRLDYVARMLGVGRKIDTSFDDWEAAYRGGEKALRKLDRYCRGDVRILERVYKAMKPYVSQLPRLVDGVSVDDPRCPFCGQDSLQRRGFYRTNASTFRKFHCQNSDCGRWSRGRTAEKDRKMATVPIP
ncbi:MAG: ribonuclease H-like domain-containing protein [Nitriliruptorales bacterium]